MAADDLAAKFRRLVDLKQAHDEARIVHDAAKRAHRDHEAELWHSLAEDQGDIKTLTVDLGEGYGTVQFQRRETIKSRVLDAEKAAASLRALGLGEAILKDTPEPRQKVLNEYVRDWLKSGARLPEGIDFIPTRYISVSKKG